MFFADLISGDETSTNLLTLVERPSVQGERLCHDLSVPVYNVPLYYAVYGEDSAGNRGHVSNIVKVQVTWTLQNIGHHLDKMENNVMRSSNSDGNGPDWLLISIMSACLGGLFIICISVITFLYISAQRNRPSSPSPSSSTHVKVSILHHSIQFLFHHQATSGRKKAKFEGRQTAACFVMCHYSLYSLLSVLDRIHCSVVQHSN